MKAVSYFKSGDYLKGTSRRMETPWEATVYKSYEDAEEVYQRAKIRYGPDVYIGELEWATTTCRG